MGAARWLAPQRYYGKQTAAYFKSLAYNTTLANNVFFNSPRSLVNYNDAFRVRAVLLGALRRALLFAPRSLSARCHSAPSMRRRPSGSSAHTCAHRTASQLLAPRPPLHRVRGL